MEETLKKSSVTKRDWLVSLASMVVFAVLYASLFQSQAKGLVFTLLILSHEAGHWLYFRKIGIDPEPPLFIPFVGALIKISTKLKPDDEVKGSLAGPFLGGIGVAALLAFCLLTENKQLYQLIQIGVFINLLNLVPLAPLDGGRVAIQLTKKLFWLGVAVMIVVIIMQNWLLLPFLLVHILQYSEVRPLWQGIARTAMFWTGGFLLFNQLNWYHPVTIPIALIIGGLSGGMMYFANREDQHYEEVPTTATKQDKLIWSCYYLVTALFLITLLLLAVHFKPLLTAKDI